MINKSITELIGNTPLLELCGYERAHNLCARLVAKVEFFNPAGSVKDRAALSMITDAEKSGRLKAGGTVIEPTSGNTGIGLAAVCAVKGYRLIITMPETMSKERRDLMSAYGAELVLTPGKDGMSGAIAKAEELHAKVPGSIIAGQFTSPSNPDAHYASTGPEIWRDTDGCIDYFVAGVGTGGTVTGTGRYLKEKSSSVKIVGVEPATSAVLSGGSAGAHGLQGIGAGFVPEALDVSVLDEVFPVTDEDAFAAAREVARTDGILVGISSGAALSAAAEIASREENAGKTVVVLLPDTGERYLSSSLFSAE